MASVTNAPNVRIISGLPLWRPNIATRRPRRAANNVTAETTRSTSIVWDLDSLQSVRDATERVRQSNDAWRHQKLAAEGVVQLERHRKVDLLREERERQNAAQRAANEARATRMAKEQCLRAEAQENARLAALAEEAVRLAEEVERRHLVAEEARRAEEGRSEAEEAIALILALEEEERLKRLDVEAAAEAARVAEEQNERRRQAEAEEERRRARLQDCAACLEQHNMADMVQISALVLP